MLPLLYHKLCLLGTSLMNSVGIYGVINNNTNPGFRYKQFDWFHDRLGEKFPCFIIPPLPEKVIAGFYPSIINLSCLKYFSCENNYQHVVIIFTNLLMDVYYF